ncbi:MAG: LAGLIDADG family homing endonuclease [Steroidobacteraceae bacterium]
MHRDGAAASQIWVRGPAVEAMLRTRVAARHGAGSDLTAARVDIPRDVGISQPVTFYAWEQGRTRPTVEHFDAYLRAVGADVASVLPQVHVGSSRLERIWETQYRNSGANLLRDHVRLADLSRQELDGLDGRDDLVLTPTHHAAHGVARYLPVDEDLLTLLGFYVAEGSCSDRNGLRLTIGHGNRRFAAEMAARMERLFGIAPVQHASPGRAAELKLVNRVIARAWQRLFGFDGAESTTKRVPDLVFNVTEPLRLAFLRGYFLGDGTAANGRIAFATSSYDLASGVMYLLSSLGVIASTSEHAPDGVVREIRGKPCQTRHRHWFITVAAAPDLRVLEPVWRDHANARGVAQRLAATDRTINRRFTALDGDLMALPITSIEEVPASNGQVYDFSVEGDENFVAGMGGLCCHNTDADVDGSHIRTLLLTFFYRQVPLLIERGHVYIAQPPLYKVKRGKQELYVKDDNELNAMLLNSALEDSALHVNSAAPPLRGSGFEMLARKYMEVQAIIRRWARRYDDRVLEQLVYMPIAASADFDRPEWLRGWVADLESRLNAPADGARRYRINVRDASDGHAARIMIRRAEHGSETEKSFTREFFDSAEYQRIADLARTLAGLVGEGAFVSRGEARQEVGSLKEAINWLFDQAKKGQSIQRYKGLGEMNPEQLWDTTINPESRRLMQVRIEDAVAADDIFTTLMGDQVEPRREFIEKNALAVANLDV